MITIRIIASIPATFWGESYRRDQVVVVDENAVRGLTVHVMKAWVRGGLTELIVAEPSLEPSIPGA